MINLVVVGAQTAGGGQPRSMKFGPAGGTIGRSNTNTLVLDDRTVSRVHAKVDCRSGRYFIVDHGSNPLQHNGRQLGAGNEAELQDGDRLMVGCFELTVQSVASTQAPQPTPQDPFADLLSGIGSPAPSTPTPSSAPLRASPSPTATDSLLFPDPMAMGAPRAAPAPVSDDDPFADLLGTGTAAPRPGAIEDFSDLGLRAPDAAAGIDHLFGGAGKASPGADPLALSPLADPLLQPNTASDADPFAALQQGAPKGAPAPRPDHLAIDRFGFAAPKAVVPTAAPREEDLFADLVPQQSTATSKSTPPAAAPAPASSAAPAVRPGPAGTSSDEAELLAAFLRGLGSTHQAPTTLTPELMERIGVLLRSAAEGTVQLLLARQEVKKGMHAELTMIAASANNPLKFSPTVEVALAHLLGPGTRGFMGAEDAMRDAYDDLRAHEFGVMVGMRAALAHVLSRFTPEEIERKIAAKSALDSLFAANRKAKLWDQFVALQGSIAAEAEDDFNTLFGKAFVKAYEEQMARLKSGGR